jgi:hypothetical protein
MPTDTVPWHPQYISRAEAKRTAEGRSSTELVADVRYEIGMRGILRGMSNYGEAAILELCRRSERLQWTVDGLLDGIRGLYDRISP